MNMTKILRMWFIRALVGATIGLYLPMVQAATLADFGYGTMRVDNRQALGTRPLLVITAVFTNYGPSLVWGNNALAERVFGGGTGRSLNGYLDENSNGRFQWTKAGVVGPVQLGVTETLDAWEAAVIASGSKDSQLFERLWFSNIIARVMVNGLFNFGPYDTAPRDGVVTGSELSILIFSNDTGSPGMNRPTGRVAPPNSQVAVESRATCVRDAESFHMLLHEGVHLLGTWDLYGRSGLNRHLSIMGANSDNSLIYHLDPWHKMMLGWVEPRPFTLPDENIVSLPAAQLRRTNAPVLLYDQASGLDEYFLIEYRTKATATGGEGYDGGVLGNGLVIWLIHQQTNHYLIDAADLLYPGLEAGWGLCTNCNSLTLSSRASMPCPSASPSHYVESDRCRLVRDQPSDPGEHGWRSCGKCGGLFYGPEQVGSICPAGGQHAFVGGGDYSLSQLPSSLAVAFNMRRCWRCELLYYHHPDPAKRTSVCPAPGGGLHAPANAEDFRLVTSGNPTLATVGGVTNAVPGDSKVWGSKALTPSLRWFDGTELPVQIAVEAFNAGDETITVHWGAWKTWVDFAHAGAEHGTFDLPFDTLREGADKVIKGGTVAIKSGLSPETGRFPKAMRIQAEGGSVTIGR